MRVLRNVVPARVVVACAVGALAIYACAGRDGQSLSGAISCGTATCGSGDVCLDMTCDGSGGKATYDYYSCVTVPAGCALPEHCEDGQGGRCPACFPLGTACSLDGRYETCWCF